MGKRTWTIGAAAILALTIAMQTGAVRAEGQTSGAHAEGMLIMFQNGVLCDEAIQVERIVSQFENKALKDVLVALNSSTGEISCGMIRRPVHFYMEPDRVVTVGEKKFLIIRLTSLRGLVQYAWRRLGEASDDGGQNV